MSGSIAFDLIFGVGDDFRDAIHVVDGEIREFNPVYVAGDKKVARGGTAGNISFWLGQEGVESCMLSAWGADFEEKGYAGALRDLGVELFGPSGEFTATSYQISDPIQQQLIIWQPNSYPLHEKVRLKEYFSEEKLSEFEYAIFAPGTPLSITQYMEDFVAANESAMKFFDPGQMVQFFSEDEFARCCELADVIIGNASEFVFFEKFGMPDALIKIRTLGENGADLIMSDVLHLDISPTDKVVETTGAGDAFRAGVIAELLENGGELNEKSIRRGLDVSARAVAYPSAQF